MRLLLLPFEIAKRAGVAAVSALYGLVKDDDNRPVAVRVPAEPEYFRSPDSPLNGGAPRERVGPEVHVAAPWAGYGRMTAAAIVGRLRTETPEVAAAVSLYEASGKGRSSVLEAAARSMR